MDTRTLEKYSDVLSRMQRLASIGTMTASVAHELNNPITIITATSGDLLAQYQEGKLDEETLLHHVQLIEQSAWRCARLVHTLRTYTHFDGAQADQTNLNEIIADGLTLVAYQFRRQFNVKIETSLAPALQSGAWRRNQLTQVLINLLINARDALQPGGGTVHVRSWALPDEDAVAFSVHDSGPGIPPEMLGKIFDPFFTTKAAGEGTGLGLSIAAAIVAQHGGQLWAENATDGGAIFTVVLPCRAERQEDVEPVQIASQQTAGAC